MKLRRQPDVESAGIRFFRFYAVFLTPCEIIVNRVVLLMLNLPFLRQAYKVCQEPASNPLIILTALFEKAPLVSSPQDWEKLLPWNIFKA